MITMIFSTCRTPRAPPYLPNSIQQTPTSLGGAAQALSQDVQPNKSKNKKSRALVELTKSTPSTELPHDSGVPSQVTSPESRDANVLVLVIQGDRRVSKIDLLTVVSCGSRGGGGEQCCYSELVHDTETQWPVAGV